MELAIRHSTGLLSVNDIAIRLPQLVSPRPMARLLQAMLAISGRLE